MSSATFKEPGSVGEARARLQDLLANMEAIHDELRDNRKLVAQGRKLPVGSYSAWRQRTLRKLDQTKQEYRFVKVWLHEWEQQEHSLLLRNAPFDPKDPEQLLLLLYRLCHKYLDFDKLEPRYKTVVVAARAYLKEVG